MPKLLFVIALSAVGAIGSLPATAAPGDLLKRLHLPSLQAADGTAVRPFADLWMPVARRRPLKDTVHCVHTSRYYTDYRRFSRECDRSHNTTTSRGWLHGRTKPRVKGNPR